MRIGRGALALVAVAACGSPPPPSPEAERPPTPEAQPTPPESEAPPSAEAEAPPSPEAEPPPSGASEDRTPSSALPLDAICATPHANLRGDDPLPPGVTRDPRPRPQTLEAGRDWRWPEAVEVTVGEPHVEDGAIIVRATIRSTSATPTTLMFSEAGAGFFHAALVGHEDRRRARRPAAEGGPPPAALFPEPIAYTLAPGAIWTVETRVILACWEALSGTVNVHWWLSAQNGSREGDARVALPPG